MRLISAVRRAELARDGAVRRGAGAPRPRGLVWSSRECVVDPSRLGSGDSVAADIDVTVEGEGRYGDNGAWIPPLIEWAIRERITQDPADLGRVFVRGGEVGRVVGVYGQKVEIEYAAGCDPAAPPASQTA